jgi:hypothetical protein
MRAMSHRVSVRADRAHRWICGADAGENGLSENHKIISALPLTIKGAFASHFVTYVLSSVMSFWASSLNIRTEFRHVVLGIIYVAEFCHVK